MPFEIDPKTMASGVGEEFESPAPRSAGFHISNILRDIENRLLKRGQRKPYDDLTDQEKSRMGKYTEMGFIWEVVVESVWKRRMLSRRKEAGAIRQTEIERDGIYMTLDAVIPGKPWIVEEYKATWLSSRHPIEGPKFWYWREQQKGYCGAVDTNRSNLFVFHVNGDYRESGPQAKAWEIEWSPRELAENWQMVTRHRDLMAKEMKNGIQGQKGRR